MIPNFCTTFVNDINTLYNQTHDETQGTYGEHVMKREMAILRSICVCTMAYGGYEAFGAATIIASNPAAMFSLAFGVALMIASREVFTILTNAESNPHRSWMDEQLYTFKDCLFPRFWIRLPDNLDKINMELKTIQSYLTSVFEDLGSKFTQ